MAMFHAQNMAILCLYGSSEAAASRVKNKLRFDPVGEKESICATF